MLHVIPACSRVSLVSFPESSKDRKSTKIIGEMVMQGLSDLDSVAYVRFASVYRHFDVPNDFKDFIGTIDFMSFSQTNKQDSKVNDEGKKDD